MKVVSLRALIILSFEEFTWLKALKKRNVGLGKAQSTGYFKQKRTCTVTLYAVNYASKVHFQLRTLFIEWLNRFNCGRRWFLFLCVNYWRFLCKFYCYIVIITLDDLLLSSNNNIMLITWQPKGEAIKEDEPLLLWLLVARHDFFRREEDWL